VVFVFASINAMYYIYRFVYVEPPLNPWDEAELVMVDDISDVLLDLVCHYFIQKCKKGDNNKHHGNPENHQRLL
jgi:hypothetical protein